MRIFHRLAALVLAVVTAVGAMGFVAASPGAALAPGDPAPPLAVRTLGGQARARIRWTDAKITAVNFWATWCLPCKTEMPALEALRQELESRGLAVVGVVLDAPGESAIKEFARATGVRYPIVEGNLAVADAWGGIPILPTTFLVDAGGKILTRWVGASEATIGDMEADLRRRLGAEPATP